MIKLNGHTLAPAEKFEPESFGLNILERQSTATITRSIDEPELQVGDWLLDDEEPGSGIVWRVKIVERNFNGRAYTYTLEHIINTLRDISMFGEVTPAMMGGGATCTALQAAQYVMARQSIWTLGDFEYNTSTAYSFNGDDLFSAMEKISSTLDDPWWEYDMSSLPFKLHIRHKSSAEACEMRMGRNISTMRMTVDRSRMYTRIYPIGKNNMHITGDYISQNEAIWGRKDRVETDQTQETEQNLYLWALDRLRRHCEPTVTVTIGGLDLSQATGETLDKLVIGTVCRVPLPAFNTTITERITKLAWRNKRKEPESVTVTLCNTRQDIASLMSQLAQEGSSAGGRGGGGRAGAKAAEEDHAWFVDTSDHVAMVAEAIIGRDGEEVDWSRVSEIIVDGSGIHQQVVLAQGSLVVAFGRMDMNEESMTTVFQKTGIDSLGNGETLYGKVTQTAESLTAEYNRATEAEGSLSGRITATAESLTAEYNRATEAEGSLSGRISATSSSLTTVYTKTGINNLGQNETLYSRITQTAESISQEVSDKTSKAAIILTLNGGSGSNAKIQADTIDIDGIVNGLKSKSLDVGGLRVEGTANFLRWLYVEDYIHTDETLSAGVDVKINGNSLQQAITGIGSASYSGGSVTIPTTRFDGTAGPNITFNMADTAWYAGRVSAFKQAVASALGSGGWTDASGASTVIQASLDTTNKVVKVYSATSRISYPGDNSPTTVSIGLGNLDVSDTLNSYARAQKNAVTLSSAGWVNGTNVVSTNAPTPQTFTVNLPAFQASGGDTFTNHKTTVYFSTQSVNAPLKTVEVDATSEYNAGYSAGVTAGYTSGYNAGVTAGAGGVTLSQGSWSDGSKRVTASNGQYVTVSLPGVGYVSWSWSNPAKGYAQASITLCGKTYSSSKQIPSGWM